MTDLSAIRKLSAEARERADKATAGQWSAGVGTHELDDLHDGYFSYVGPYSDDDPTDALGYGLSQTVNEDPPQQELDDFAFIAAARTDVPALCDAVDELTAEVERLRAALAAETERCAAVAEECSFATCISREIIAEEIRRGAE